MFSANSELQVSQTDFDTIKESFKEFVKNKTEFTDYNFEGSTLNQLLNVMSYNTYMNSFYTNMAVNEGFLDTAQIRANVVSNAKKQGYLPYSASAAKATIRVSFASTTNLEDILIPSGSKFKGTKDGVVYNFHTIQDYSCPHNGVNFQTTIDIYEGTPVTQTFVYSDEVQYYEILNSNVDLATLEVSVRETSSSSNRNVYTRMVDLTEITSESEVYFIQENYKERYEIYFGDDVLGKKLTNGNIITISYLATNGSIANDIRSFQSVGYSGVSQDGTSQYSTVLVETLNTPVQGSEKEGIESIRFNSKHFHNIQNRFVTKNDYTYFIKNKFPFVDSIKVWGGEEHDPPLFGKVIISIRPKDGYVLSPTTKDTIKKELLTRNVMTIEPLFVDPSYLFINPKIFVRYDQKKTILDGGSVYNKISQAVRDFESVSLSNFGEFFKYSSFVNAIESVDKSIESTETTVTLEKRMTPVLGSTLSYKFTFSNELYNPYEGFKGCISSTSFKTNTNSNDLFLDDDGLGKLRLFYVNSIGQNVYVNEDAGTVDYQTGQLALKAIKFVSFKGNEIRFFAKPSRLNFYPIRNQILLLSYPELSLFDVNTDQLLSSNIIDVNGNLITTPSTSIDIPVVF